MADNKNEKVLVTHEKSIGSNLMRGRDVIAALRPRNLDPILIETMARIAEINHINMKAIAEIATMQDQLITLVQSFSDVAANMKDRTDQMARAMGETVEDAGAQDTEH